MPKPLASSRLLSKFKTWLRPHYHTHRATVIRNLVMLHDISMTGLVVFLAYWLRLDGNWRLLSYRFDSMAVTILVSLGASLVIFRALGLHRGIWRYASLRDLKNIAIASVGIALVLAIAGYVMHTRVVVPRSIPIMVLLLLPLGLAGPRIAYRMLKDRTWTGQAKANKDAQKLPVLAIGDDPSVMNFLRGHAYSADSPYRVLGVLSLESARTGSEVFGVRVLGTVSRLEYHVKELERLGIKPRRLILGASVLRDMQAKTESYNLFDQAQDLGLQLSRLSRADQTVDDASNPAASAVKPIALEDVLGREPRVFDRSRVADRLQACCVLVTGAGGSIGSELCRQIAAMPIRSLVLLDNCEYNLYSIELELRTAVPNLTIVPILADIRNASHVQKIVSVHKPQHIFHAAALKHVPLVEQNPSQGVLSNVFGTQHLIDAAIENDAISFTLVSTDKAVNPSSIMGACKRLAEKLVQRAAGAGTGTQFLSVRFGNVLGSSGSVVPLFTKQLAQGGPLTITHPEMTRYFMTIKEASALILQAFAMPPAAQTREAHEGDARIYVLDMGEAIKIDALARQMIRLAGLRPDIDIKLVYTGVRPGEKLYEELFYDSKAVINTHVDGLMVSTHETSGRAVTDTMLAELKAAADRCDDQAVFQLVQQAVSSYTPDPRLLSLQEKLQKPIEHTP